MNKFIKKIVSLCLCMAVILGISTSPYAQTEETSALFFGKSSIAGDKNTFPQKIGEYLKETYKNIYDLSDVLDGFKTGFESVDDYDVKSAAAFFTFNGSETETELAYTEGTIRKLYEKDSSLIVNFIIFAIIYIVRRFNKNN